MKYLDIYAGKTALATIKQNGFDQSLFDIMLGASGGPKWFVLFGLDKFLFGDFFAGRKQPLHLLGSSAGAFRFACLAQQDPVAAITRLAQSYSTTRYGKNATATEVTEKAIAMLGQVLKGEAVAEIIHNPIVKAHFIVAKTHNGLVAKPGKLAQLSGLSVSYALNRLGRKHLKHQYSRYVFHAQNSQLTIDDPHQIPTSYVTLDERNLADALLASGAIPVIIDGVADIEGAEPGIYRDGGIIDYHFDLAYKLNDRPQPGLTLYPHFSAVPKAGWFDKSLKRKVNPAHYDNVVMLVPNQRFIDELPLHKIPDRKDFEQVETEQRIQNWQKVLELSDLLAQEFQDFVAQPDFSQIKPLF